MDLNCSKDHVEQSDATAATPIVQKKEAASRGTGSMETMLGDLAVEAVFPTAGIIRLNDWVVSGNELIMRLVQECEIFREEDGLRVVTAGSSAEGVALERGWGHPQADQDIMELYGDLAVGVDGPGELPPGGVTLMYRGEECPPAYTRLEVMNKDWLLEVINRHQEEKEVPADMCVEEEGGRQWLLSHRLVDAMRSTHTSNVQGPAASAQPGGLWEFIMALVVTGPHPDMVAYSERPRIGWPSQTQLQYLLTLCMLIVCVGPKGHPDAGRLFRVSTSLHEMSLINPLPLWMKQGYICLKYVLKVLLASSRQGDDDGRSRVGSYHFKTVFLWYLEEHPPQPEGSPYNLTLNLCRKLQQVLVNRIIHNYFIPDCNLLEKVGERKCQEALGAVDKVLHDPLAAIIGSASRPEQIFGSRHNKADLLRCFQAVSDQPACGATREALQRLLRDLDEHRVRRYAKQLRMDKALRVSGRPGLVRLAERNEMHKPCHGEGIQTPPCAT